MRNLRLTGLALLCLTTAFISCSKKEDTAKTTQSTKDVLMAFQWKKSEYKENGTVMSFFGPCEMDDILSFTATNWVLDDGTNTCSTSGSTDFYSIEADNKTMRWNYGVGEITFNSTKTAFTFRRTGANTFEYIFVRK